MEEKKKKIKKPIDTSKVSGGVGTDDNNDNGEKKHQEYNFDSGDIN